MSVFPLRCQYRFGVMGHSDSKYSGRKALLQIEAETIEYNVLEQDIKSGASCHVGSLKVNN